MKSSKVVDQLGFKHSDPILAELEAHDFVTCMDDFVASFIYSLLAFSRADEISS